MVEFLFNFIKKNKLKPIIETTIYNETKYHSFQWVKLDPYQREISKTLPILAEYDSIPSTNTFVGDIIALFKSISINERTKQSYIQVLGKDTFNTFLTIHCEDDSTSSVIRPIAKKEWFTIRIRIERLEVKSYNVTNFSEVLHYCSNEEISEIHFENATIRELSFLLPNYKNHLRLSFTNCIIYSFIGISQNILGDLRFLSCAIYGFATKPIPIVSLTFNKCDKVNISANDSFLFKTEKIEIYGGEITKLSNIFPSKSIAKKIVIDSTSIKTMYGFPMCPFIEELYIQNNANLMSLKGMPKSLPYLHTFKLSENPMLKVLHSFPKSENLRSLNLESSYFIKGKLEQMPKLMELNINSNDAHIFQLLPQCDFVMFLNATKIRGIVASDIFNKFTALKVINLEGTEIQFTPQTIPRTFFDLAIFYATSKFTIVGSQYKKEYFEKISRNFSASTKLKQTIDTIIYDLYIYCTSNLLNIVELLSKEKKIQQDSWLYQYFENEDELEHYEQCVYILNKKERTDVITDLLIKLHKKYKKRWMQFEHNN
jgi:hypothetical protein